MKIHILFIMLILLMACGLQAQVNGIAGMVWDGESGEALPGANVMILQNDSIITGTQSNAEGKFFIKGMPAGDYKLMITFLGYSIYTQAISVTDGITRVGKIAMQPGEVNLEEVQIKGEIPPVVQKGDTTEFNSSAYKTNPNATAEDMLEKMPGFVSKDGKTQAQGEDVQQVLVDGKPFFGSDPNAALKNLPAEVIEKIQVFDQQSDQSRLTGVDDGQTKKTINIITKPEMRDGVFGRIYGGYGYEDVYHSGVALNIFNGKRRITLLGQSNNINVQNFAAEDLGGVVSAGGGGRGGPGGRRYGRGRSFSGGDADDFLVDQQQGISTTHAAGVNFTDKWGKKVDINFSYFFNQSENAASQTLSRDYIAATDSGLRYTENSNSVATNTNHRINMRLNYEIDSMTTLLITPSFKIQQYSGNEAAGSSSLVENSAISSTDKYFSTSLYSWDASTDLILTRRFKKKGRSLALFGRFGFDEQEAENSLYSLNSEYEIPTDTINQESFLDQSGLDGRLSLSYTEPAGENGTWMFRYTGKLEQNDSEKLTFDFAGTDVPEIDSALSNVFGSVYQAHEGSFGYNYRKDKLFMMVRGGLQWAALDNDQTYPTDVFIRREFISFLPMGIIRYNFTPKNSLRVFYRTDTDEPQFSQLQEVLDNSNPLLLSIGNSNLKQTTEHRVFVRYSASNTEKETTFFAMIGGSYNHNYIADKTIIPDGDTVITTFQQEILLERGSQLSLPVNMNGNWDMRSFVSFGRPLKFIKSNLNLNFGVSWNRRPGMINDEITISNTYSSELGIVVSSNISENFDFTVSFTPSGNYVSNSLEPELNSTYYFQNSRLKLMRIFPKLAGFFIQTELSHQLYSGLSEDFNEHFLLWNAAIGKRFFDGKGEFKISVFDLLDQNNSIQRNTTSSYIEDIRTVVLRRYVMGTLTWNIRAFKTGKDKNGQQ